MRRRETRIVAETLQRGPQRAGAAVGEVEQRLLVEADDRRDQQPGQIEVVMRLNRERNSGEQVLDR